MDLAQDRQPTPLRREMQRVTQKNFDPTLVTSWVGQFNFEGLAQAQEASSDRIESRFEPIEVFKEGKFRESKVADKIGTLRIVREDTLMLGIAEDILHEFAQSWSITIRVESDSRAFPTPEVDAPLVGQKSVPRTLVLPFGVQSNNKEFVDGSGRNPPPTLRLLTGRHRGAISLALRVALAETVRDEHFRIDPRDVFKVHLDDVITANQTGKDILHFGVGDPERRRNFVPE